MSNEVILDTSRKLENPTLHLETVAEITKERSLNIRIGKLTKSNGDSKITVEAEVSLGFIEDGINSLGQLYDKYVEGSIKKDSIEEDLLLMDDTEMKEYFLGPDTEDFDTVKGCYNDDEEDEDEDGLGFFRLKLKKQKKS